MKQWYCIVGGEQYGPVDEAMLRSWAQQGRLQPSDLVWSEGMADWAPASSVPGLVDAQAAAQPYAPAAREPTASAYAAQPAQPAWSPAPQPAAQVLQPAPSGVLAPHRGPVILTLGILGLAGGCFILGIIAWVMGRKDLPEIDAGRMDPAGRSMAHAGMILGMIGTILCLLALIGLPCCMALPHLQ